MQVALFQGVVGGGRAIEGLVFRVDSLSLLFGVLWSLAVGLAALGARSRVTGQSFLPYWLFGIGLPLMAYAREGFVLYAGWEVATFGLWLALYAAAPGAGRLWGAVTLFLPGLPFLLLVAAGALPPFAPPAGGAAPAIPFIATLAFGVATVLRALPWLLAGTHLQHQGVGVLAGVYALSAPLPLAKLLVAAPLEPVGSWLLALMGMLALLCLPALFLTRPISGAAATGGVLAGAAITGLGLAMISPLAAAGALGLLVVGALLIVAQGNASASAVMPLAILPSVWLLSQGALGTGYGVVAVLLSPCLVGLSLVLVWSRKDREPGGCRAYTILAVALTLLLALSALFPQTLVEWLLRPAVGALAGGVGPLSQLSSDWGIGLWVRSPQNTMEAVLPATAIGVAIFLAAVTLYWLKRLLLIFSPDQHLETPLT